MPIRYLCNYYDYKANDPSSSIVPENFEAVNIAYLIYLNESGEIVNIGNYKDGKQKILIPAQEKKNSAWSYVPEYRGKYLFGIAKKKDGFVVPSSFQRFHKAFVDRNLEYFENVDSPLVRAYVNFIKTWNSDDELGNPYVILLGKDIELSTFAFCMEGDPGHLLHEDPLLIDAVTARNEDNPGKEEESGKDVAIYEKCIITNEYGKIARKHPKIPAVKDIKDGNTPALISGDKEAFNSYNRVRGNNNHISEAAAMKYAKALESLKEEGKRKRLGKKLSIFFWALPRDNTDNLENLGDIYEEMFKLSIFDGPINKNDEDEIKNEDDASNELRKTIENIEEGLCGDAEISTKISKNIDFYILGISSVSNGSRALIQFFYKNTFGDLLENIKMHQADISINGNNRIIPLWMIFDEMKDKKSTHGEYSDAASARFFESIIQGTPYPAEILSTIIRRIGVDRDNEDNGRLKINDIRVGIIKGYLNRKARASGRKEVITMALNENINSPAYLCGRIFAILENLQYSAMNSKKLNVTLRNTYYRPASTTPAQVFPRIIDLGEYYASKADNGEFKWRELCRIIARLENGFPKALNLEEQGMFAVGYSQQREEIYRKKTDTTTSNN